MSIAGRFLDCKNCDALGYHTEKAGCIIAVARAAAANAVGNALIYGQEVDWSETDEGHLTVYDMAPNLIPADQAARVIYELRCDVQRLNSEAIDYFERLKKVRTFADEQVKGH